MNPAELWSLNARGRSFWLPNFVQINPLTRFQNNLNLLAWEPAIIYTRKSIH